MSCLYIAFTLLDDMFGDVLAAPDIVEFDTVRILLKCTRFKIYPNILRSQVGIVVVLPLPYAVVDAGLLAARSHASVKRVHLYCRTAEVQTKLHDFCPRRLSAIVHFRLCVVTIVPLTPLCSSSWRSRKLPNNSATASFVLRRMFVFA